MNKEDLLKGELAKTQLVQNEAYKEKVELYSRLTEIDNKVKKSNECLKKSFLEFLNQCVKEHNIVVTYAFDYGNKKEGTLISFKEMISVIMFSDEEGNTYSLYEVNFDGNIPTDEVNKYLKQAGIEKNYEFFTLL